MEDKRLYSINCAATVMVLTQLMPTVRLDEESNTYYCVFPPCKAVEAAIKSFRSDARLTININEFLRAIKYIRTAMNLKGTGGEKLDS